MTDHMPPTPVSLRVPPDLLAILDAWCASQFVPPSRNQAIIAILAHFLHTVDQKPK